MHSFSVRICKELERLQVEPPPGIAVWPLDGENLLRLGASIAGPAETPYEGGVFSLALDLSTRYPLDPPKVRFVTPIYHPNIDTAGRICLDVLKMPPKGAWTPALGIATLLHSIQVLMADPNPDDPLMEDVSREFKYNRAQFEEKARLSTAEHAREPTGPQSVEKASTTRADGDDSEEEELTDEDADVVDKSECASKAGILGLGHPTRSDVDVVDKGVNESECTSAVEVVGQKRPARSDIDEANNNKRHKTE